MKRVGEHNDRALDYFPPKGTKYEWGSKSLQHRPHLCLIQPLGHSTAQYALLSCSYFEGGYYQATVEFNSINHKRKYVNTRYYKKELAACLAAEKIADELLSKDTPPWAMEALKCKWRPPCFEN